MSDCFPDARNKKKNKVAKVPTLLEFSLYGGITLARVANKPPNI